MPHSALEHFESVQSRACSCFALEGLGGSYLRRIDSCIIQIKALGPSRTCNESKEEEESTALEGLQGYLAHKKHPPPRITLGP